ncbi:MAG TPA: SH3 domain-containing protein [Hymenobacter sp.]|jgi:hypothetical protein
MKQRILFYFFCLLSFTSVAQQTDSAEQTVIQEQAPVYRYVNASSLTLRTQPTASALAVATISGASRVHVLDIRTDGWSKVEAQDYTGYVKSSYLVEDQQEVTAETIDWDVVQANGGTDYTSVVAVEVTTPAVYNTSSHGSRKAALKVATGPKVYICGNGRTEVYHSSEGCSAMRRCTYQTLVMTESQARSSGLRGCMKCY